MLTAKKKKKLHWEIVVQDGVLFYFSRYGTAGLSFGLSESDMLNVLFLVEKCLQYKLQIAFERSISCLFLIHAHV